MTKTPMANSPQAQSDDQPKIIGGPENFWLYHSHSGFDLTHPPTPSAPKVYPRMTLQTYTSHITIAPAKTALVIIDLQNYFLSPSLKRPSTSPGLLVVEKLKTEVIPAVRKSGIAILWLGWGLSDDDIETMPPTIIRGFALDNNFEDGYKVPGLGEDIGEVKLDGDDGSSIEGGKVLVRNQWNSEIYTPLQRLAQPNDMRAWKNRLSGFWSGGGGGGTDVEGMLGERGIRSLIFAGCNTDQCVAASLVDAAWKGWDCVLLSDATATTSPGFAQRGVEWNMEGWGFRMTCKDLVEGVSTLETE